MVLLMLQRAKCLYFAFLLEFLHHRQLKVNGSVKVLSSAGSELLASGPIQAVNSIPSDSHVKFIIQDSMNKLASADGDFLRNVTETLDSTGSLITPDDSGNMLHVVDDEDCSQQRVSSSELYHRSLISSAADDTYQEHSVVFPVQNRSAPAQFGRLDDADVCSEEPVVKIEDSYSSSSYGMNYDNILHALVLPQVKCSRRKVGIYGTCKTKIRTEMFK
jgi:hypothetical protein